MATSMLCSKVNICRLIEQLNEKGCREVVELLHDELECGSLNNLLIKIIIHLQDIFALSSLENLEQSIQELVNNDKYSYWFFSFTSYL